MNFLEDSDFSSDEHDNDLSIFLEWERRLYTVKSRIYYFHLLDDVDFHMRFRLTKETVLFALSLIERRIETDTDRPGRAANSEMV